MISKEPKIMILGAGAVGLSIAGMLSKNCYVSAVCRKRHADAISQKGLYKSGIWGEEIIHDIRCYTKSDELFEELIPSDNKKFDFIIITSKSSDTEKICEEYQNLFKNNIIVSIQNGIGNEEIIEKYAENIIGATITTNFSSPKDGFVKVMSESEPLKLGIYPCEFRKNSHNNSIPDYNSELEQLIEIFKKSGINAKRSKNIRSAIWEKSLLNIAVNPLTALLSIPVGDVLDENLKSLITGLIKETFLVMSAKKITTKWAGPEDYLNYLFDILIPSFSNAYTSMYQDIQLNRKTEIDFINGAVVRFGKEQKIETPFNSCICSLIKYQENKVSLSQCTQDQ
ncbi:2-dehydropantoate 2-reductase [Methanomicrobium antiquum]|uniref:2-dehydropantoate 2-reductase n=1 Tax=Methanomicrobium antiquum TaxID=487686 RepID=A0AAF0FT90_9EURY|nr:2-dehydropantoate 2-reductase [Methanomicrobium antiquum]WFN37726.1 2-dehydropantoate 2-reductase [Methanomicrobium antiquum]